MSVNKIVEKAKATADAAAMLDAIAEKFPTLFREFATQWIIDNRVSLPPVKGSTNGEPHGQSVKPPAPKSTISIRPEKKLPPTQAIRAWLALNPDGGTTKEIVEGTYRHVETESDDAKLAVRGSLYQLYRSRLINRVGDVFKDKKYRNRIN